MCVYKNSIKFILCLIVFSQISCTRSKVDSSIPTKEPSFEPRIPNSTLTLKDDIQFLPLNSNKQSLLLKNTEDLFLFLTESINLGVKKNDKAIIDKAHSIVSKFYNNRDNYTSYDSKNTPYSYIFLEEDAKNGSFAINYLKNMASNISLEIKGIIENMEINKFNEITKIEDYNLRPYFNEIRFFLGRIGRELAKNSTLNRSAIDAINSVIEAEYIPIINKLEETLSHVHIGNTLEENLDILEKIYVESVFLQKADTENNLIDGIQAQRSVAKNLQRNMVDLLHTITAGRVKSSNEHLLIQQANYIIKYLDQIPKVISDIFYAEINNMISNDVALKENIHAIIASNLDKIIFNKKNHPALEFYKIHTNLSQGNNITFSKQDNSNKTTSRTLATSIPLLIERLNHISQSSSLNEEYGKILFSTINKLVSSIGYSIDDETNEVYTGLFLPFGENSASNERVNVRNYYTGTDQGYFGIPDSLVVKDGFEIDFEQTFLPEMRTSVNAQAEFIIALSKILNFLRPDRVNSFDLFMNSYHINQFSLFPKETLFLFHLGLSSVFFTNFQKRGILLYDKFGDHRAVQMADLRNEKDIFMVSVSDVININNVEQQNNKVSTKDMAKLIMSFDMFLNFIDSFDPNSLDSDFSNIFHQESFIEIKELVRKSILGLGFFLISKLQMPYGGFYDSYNVDKNYGNDILSLDTQVQAIRGLLAMHNHRWESNLVKLVITDTYRIMNSRLFDTELGFYKVDEHTKQMPNIRLVTETLSMLYELDNILFEEDLKTLEDSRDYWFDRYSKQISELE